MLTPTISSQGSSVVTNKGDAFASFDVEDFPVPSHRDENWRFTPLRRLRGIHDDTAGDGGRATGASRTTVTGDGIVVETVGRDDERLGTAGAPMDRVAARAFSSFTEATIVSVPDEGVAGTGDEPVTIAVAGPGAGLLAYSHLQIRVGRFARAVIVIDNRGGGMLVENVEFVLADSAELTVVSIQDGDEDALHLSGHQISLGRDARIRHTLVTLGGEIVRIVPTVRYRDTGGDAQLLGLYYADAGQHLEHRLLVDHSVPHCRSDVLYKGALQGDTASGLPEAHTVWVGDILIRAAAEGTNTYEINRNLVLTEGARADSVPNLEIETGEIAGAGHASTTGRFDDEQIFYLRARGIPEDVARRLVVRGFFHEVIQRIGVATVVDRLTDAIEHELELSGS